MIDQKSEPQSAAAAAVRTKPRGFISDFCHSSVGRKMIVAVTGVILILFVIGRLLGNPQFRLLNLDPLNRYDAHSLMVYGFQHVYVSTCYLVGLLLLTRHLTHGSSSFFPSRGLNNQRVPPRLAIGGRILAWLLFIGYTSIPIAVLLGFIKPAQQL